LADSKEPVDRDKIPEHLAGAPLLVCKHHGYVELFNANIERRFPSAYIPKGSYRYYDPETERELGTVLLDHMRLSKEGRICLAEYRLRREPQSSKTEQGQEKKGRGRPVKKETKQRAAFAKPLLDQGLTWPEIYERYAKTPEGKADTKADPGTMRLAYDRHYPAK
jgi:hypothetical protein